MKEYPMNLPLLSMKLKELYGSIGAIREKKILVIREREVALMLASRNSVIYITDDPDCAEDFRKYTDAGMGDDDQVILINKFDKKFKLEEVTGDMKFDCAILNPPYDRNLHLKILEQVIAKADKVVNISPVRWLQDPFAPYSTRSDYCKFEDSISKKIETLDIIPAKDASQLFDASFSMNLGIYVCGKGGYEYQHNDPLITKIVEKTMTNNWMPFGPKNYYNGNIEKKNFALNVAGFGDPIMCKTYASQLTAHLVSKDNAMHGGGSKRGGHFEFDTEEERKNFYDCYTHPFMLWHAKLWKVDQSTYDDKVPYFSDYTHSWDYKDFFTWFDLTEEEQARVMQEITQMQAE